MALMFNGMFNRGNEKLDHLTKNLGDFSNYFVFVTSTRAAVPGFIVFFYVL